jgi:hypothetical protein
MSLVLGTLRLAGIDITHNNRSCLRRYSCEVGNCDSLRPSPHSPSYSTWPRTIKSRVLDRRHSLCAGLLSLFLYPVVVKLLEDGSRQCSAGNAVCIPFLPGWRHDCLRKTAFFGREAEEEQEASETWQVHPSQVLFIEPWNIPEELLRGLDTAKWTKVRSRYQLARPLRYH